MCIWLENDGFLKVKFGEKYYYLNLVNANCVRKNEQIIYLETFLKPLLLDKVCITYITADEYELKIIYNGNLCMYIRSNSETIDYIEYTLQDVIQPFINLFNKTQMILYVNTSG